MKRVNYTPEQGKFLRENYQGRSAVETAAAFNAQFGTEITAKQVRSFVNRRGITSGRLARFEKGNTPWNLGRKGLAVAPATAFKKGCVPKNIKPLGSERICPQGGFILIKVTEKNPYTGYSTRYKPKHIHVYEQVYGPVPPKKVVAFKDGDKLNCDPENLMLLDRAEAIRLNRYAYKEAPDEVKPSLVAIVKLEVKVSKLLSGIGKQL